MKDLAKSWKTRGILTLGGILSYNCTDSTKVLCDKAIDTAGTVSAENLKYDAAALETLLLFRPSSATLGQHPISSDLGPF